jgi:RNA polymerase sigma factor (sigma-70 family)
MDPGPAHNSLSEWFRRWRSPLRRFLVGRGAVRVADLDDIAQEVFMRLLRYESAEVVRHPQAYIFKMAANVAAEWALRARHRLAHEPRWLNGLVAQDTTEEAFDSGVLQREIKRALQTLTARERAILKLYFEEGLTKAEVALRLGLSPRMVQRDFESSYRKLRHELGLRLTGALSHGRE